MKFYIKNSLLRKTMKALRFTAICMALSLSLVAGGHAESYPERDIEMLVGFSAGGPTDAAARIIAEELGKQIGTNVVVVNRPGAGGEVAAAELLRRDADGYTLFLGTNGLLTVKPAVYKRFRFKPEDFDLIGTVASYFQVAVVSDKSEAEDFASLINILKKREDGGSVASAANSHDLAYEWINTLIPDLNLARIPYKGTSQVVSDLLANRVDLALVSPNVAQPLLDSGDIRALALTSEASEGSFSSYPTIAESYPGLERFDMRAWSGLIVKGGTPDNIRSKLNAGLASALKSDEVNKKLYNLGMTTFVHPPAEFGELIKDESSQWEAIANRAGLQFD